MNNLKNLLILKIAIKNLIFWLGLVQLATAFFWYSKNHLYTVIGIRVALFYIEAIICLALLLVKSERV